MFVDIHNHIIPGVDDGAISMGEALDMARMAADHGTDIMVATPHRAAYQRSEAPPNWVRAHVRALQHKIDEAEIHLQVAPGVEIPIGPQVAADLVGGRTLTIGDAGHWALIEPPFDHIPKDAFDNLRAIMDSGFKVVLAHPERNAVIQKSLTFLETCARFGVNIQLTSGSLLGDFGSEAKETAEAILKHAPEWKIVIASDAHDLVNRPTTLVAKARDAAAKIVGEAEANEMVDKRPRAMVRKLWSPKPQAAVKRHIITE